MDVKALAKRMATTARSLRDLIRQEVQGTLESEGEAFADLWAQVLCYGVFAERVREFERQGAAEIPAVHGYELFLEEYDATIRERRGVYYTPAPVVAYIVKSVDDLLVTRFSLRDGLAERKQVQVIDPAVGTGAFLQGVIDLVERRVRESAISREAVESVDPIETVASVASPVSFQGDASWAAFVREHLLARLHGVEVMPAPHAIAHVTLEARLAESGVQLGEGDRFDIRLGNSLEEELQKELLAAVGVADFGQAPAGQANEAIRERHAGENGVPVLVVLGNPPYANFGRMNRNRWIEELLQTYKMGLQERKTNLHDDYIKFMRLAQWQVEQVGQGVVAMVTNHSFLGGLTHRRMRESLLESFDEIFVLNLHGDLSERHAWPEDENVFEITRGVAITMLVRTLQKRGHHRKARVFYRDLVGSREEKYAFLQANRLTSTAWEEFVPTEGSFSFLPQAGAHAEEYAGYWSVADIFTVCHSGIQTKRDKLAIHFEEASLAEVLEQLRAMSGEDELEAWREERALGPDSSGWRLQAAAEDVRQADGVVVDVQYRPFDLRKTYFTGRSNGFLGRPRAEVTRHFLQPNLALATMRQLDGVPDRCAVLATKHMLTDRAMYSRNGTPYVFPLYSYGTGQRRAHNLHRGFLAALEASTGMRFDEERSGAPTDTFAPEDVFTYLYAVLHGEPYREWYAAFLKKDFPRVPAQVEREAFTELARLGKRLVTIHTLEDIEVEPIVLHALGTDRVQKARYAPESQRLYINNTQYFAPVTPEMWHYRAGGYQVAAQWLKERRGRMLSAAEQEHFSRLLTMPLLTADVIIEINSLVLDILTKYFSDCEHF